MPISQIKPVLIGNAVTGRRIACEPIIRHDTMLPPSTGSLKNASMVRSREWNKA
jgi:hypothetical protein